MGVIAEVRVPSEDFELGRVLRAEGGTTVELEPLVPTGDRAVPLFWVHDQAGSEWGGPLEDHPSVRSISVVESFDDRALYSLDWDAERDPLFGALRANGGHATKGVGTAEEWNFELLFPNHGALEGFNEDCRAAGTGVEASRVCSHAEPHSSKPYGLTDPQHEAITLAVRRGYFDVPRETATEDLAVELGISDQATSERIRRGVKSLVTNALLDEC